MQIKRPLMVFCILIIVLCIFKNIIHQNAFPQGILPEEAITLQGRLDAWECENRRTILYLSDVFFYGDSTEEIANDNSIGIRCYVMENDNLKLGQTIAVRGFLTLPEHEENPGGFDGATYYQSRGYTYVLYDGEVVVKGEKYDVILQGLWQVKEYATEQLNCFLADEDAGIMTAMLLGDKTDIDTDIKTLYRSTGIYHILAISGVNTLNLVSLSKSQMPNLRAFPQVLLRKFTLFYQQFLSGFCPLVVLPLFRGCFSKLTKWQKEYLFAKV